MKNGPQNAKNQETATYIPVKEVLSILEPEKDVVICERFYEFGDVLPSKSPKNGQNPPQNDNKTKISSSPENAANAKNEKMPKTSENQNFAAMIHHGETAPGD